MNTQNKMFAKLLAVIATVTLSICGFIAVVYGGIVSAWLSELSRLSLLFISAIGLVLILGAVSGLLFGLSNGALLIIKKIIGLTFEYNFMFQNLERAKADNAYRMAEVNKTYSEARLIEAEAVAKAWQVATVSATKGAVIINNGVPTMIPPLAAPMALAAPSEAVSVLPHEAWFPTAANALHLIVIGESGSGKSTLAKALANVASEHGRVVVLDSHGRASEWPNLEIIGSGRNYEAINGFMSGALTELANRYKAYESGQNEFTRLTMIIDETTSVASKCELWPQFFADISCEGRKVEMRLIVLIHGKGVRTLRLEGQGDLRHNLQFVFLGKHAVEKMKAAAAMERPACMEVNGVTSLIDTSKLAEIGTLQKRLHAPLATNESNLEACEAAPSELTVTPKEEADKGHDSASLIAKLANDKERVIAALLLNGMADSAIAKHLGGNYDSNLSKVSKVRNHMNGSLKAVGA